MRSAIDQSSMQVQEGCRRTLAAACLELRTFLGAALARAVEAEQPLQLP